MAAKKESADRRVVIDASQYEPQELLALAKMCDAKSKAVVEARGKVENAKVYTINVTVRVVGDIEVGTPEKTPEKFDSEKYFLAALAALTPAVRKKVLKRPVIKKTVAAAMRAELEVVKERRKMVPSPAKLTPHLKVFRVQGGVAVEPQPASAAA